MQLELQMLEKLKPDSFVVLERRPVEVHPQEWITSRLGPARSASLLFPAALKPACSLLLATPPPRPRHWWCRNVLFRVLALESQSKEGWSWGGHLIANTSSALHIQTHLLISCEHPFLYLIPTCFPASVVLQPGQLRLKCPALTILLSLQGLSQILLPC